MALLWNCIPRCNLLWRLLPTDLNLLLLKIATDQIKDICISLHYLGVSICSKSYMFGDNQSVMISSTISHSDCNKRHNALSYHHVKKALAAEILGFFCIDGRLNVSDVLSNHCRFQQAWHLVMPLLFWMGHTLDCDAKGEKVEGVNRKTKVKKDYFICCCNSYAPKESKTGPWQESCHWQHCLCGGDQYWRMRWTGCQCQSGGSPQFSLGQIRAVQPIKYHSGNLGEFDLWLGDWVFLLPVPFHLCSAARPA